MLKRLSGILLAGAMLTSPALSKVIVVYGAAEQYWAINGMVDSEGKNEPSCSVSTNWPDPDAEHLAYVEFVTTRGPKDLYNGWIQITIPHLNISALPDVDVPTSIGTRKTAETNVQTWDVTMKKASGNPDMLLMTEPVSKELVGALLDSGVLYIFRDSKNEMAVDLNGFRSIMDKMDLCMAKVEAEAAAIKANPNPNDFSPAPKTKDQERVPQTNPDGSTNRPLDTPA